jgi:hypothetical protein
VRPCSVRDPLLTPMSYGFASAAFGFDAAMREPDQD